MIWEGGSGGGLRGWLGNRFWTVAMEMVGEAGLGGVLGGRLGCALEGGFGGGLGGWLGMWMGQWLGRYFGTVDMVVV